MDKYFHPTLRNGWNYLFTLGFKLIHISKRTAHPHPPQYRCECRPELVIFKIISKIATSSCETVLGWMLQDITWWRHQMETFPRYWPFVRGIHRSPVNSPHKGQWRGALMFSLICAWINGWVNNREAGDLRRYRAHYDVTVMTDDKIILVQVMAWCYQAFIHCLGHCCTRSVSSCGVTRPQWVKKWCNVVKNHHVND